MQDLDLSFSNKRCLFRNVPNINHVTEEHERTRVSNPCSCRELVNENSMKERKLRASPHQIKNQLGVEAPTPAFDTTEDASDASGLLTTLCNIAIFTEINGLFMNLCRFELLGTCQFLTYVMRQDDTFHPTSQLASVFVCLSFVIPLSHFLNTRIFHSNSHPTS